MKRNYYKILGLQPGASREEIKTAYRNLARKFHPDINKADNASTRFKEISEAYQALIQDDGREKQGTRTEFHEDVFANFFRQRFGEDIFNGVRHPPHNNRRGTQVQIPVTLAARGGTIPVREGAQTIHLQIPPNTASGDKLRVDSHFGRRVFSVEVVDDGQYKIRPGGVIEMDVRINYISAILGGTIKIESPKGEMLLLKIPPRTSSHTTMRLRQEGLGGADLYVKIGIDIPIDVPPEILNVMEKQGRGE